MSESPGDKVKYVFWMIKNGQITTQESFSEALRERTISVHLFIEELKKAPDVEILDWIDSDPAVIDGLNLVAEDWIVRNINPESISPADWARLTKSHQN